MLFRSSFALNTCLEKDLEVFQQVFQTSIKGLELRFTLGENGNPKAFVLLDTNIYHYFPPGDLRTTLQGASTIHQNASYLKESGQLSIGPEYSIRIESDDWTKTLVAGDVISVDGGRFRVAKEQETVMKIKHAGISGNVINLRKEADPDNWRLVGTDWKLITEDDKQFYELEQILGTEPFTTPPKLAEVSQARAHRVLDFFDPEQLKQLRAIVKANNAEVDAKTRTKTPTQELLERVLSRQKTIDGNEKTVEKLTGEIAALEVKYDELEVDPSNTFLGNQALRGIRERIVRLDINKMNLEKESKQLRIEINADLFPALESPSSSRQGFYSLAK